MCTALPVYRGEIQCRELGMAIAAFTETGTPAGPEEAGELVCTRPFPCMPVGFWPLPGYGAEDAVRAAKARFQDAYFKPECPGVWCEHPSHLSLQVKHHSNPRSRVDHGDHIMITKSRGGNGGGIVMLGRSDGVL
jgi:acetoacetyl-CoA synthetase